MLKKRLLWIPAVFAAVAFLGAGARAHADSSLYIATLLLATGEDGAAYSQTVTAVGGTSPYTWAIAAGALPSGLALTSSTGVISGTPGTAGISDFAIRVIDATGLTATQGLTITTNPKLTMSNAPPASGHVGQAYTQMLIAGGGVSPFNWAIATGALPAGLTLNAPTGQISGTPTTIGTSAFTAQVTDRLKVVATQAFSITINTAAEVFAITVNTPAGPTPPAAGGTGVFAVAPVFSRNVVFLGGSVAQLDAALVAASAAGAWAQDSNGVFILYVVGGTFVNEAFGAAFAGGLPNPIALTVVGK